MRLLFLAKFGDESTAALLISSAASETVPMPQQMSAIGSGPCTNMQTW